MDFQLPELPAKLPSTTYYSILGIVAAAIVVLARLSRRSNLDAFPMAGSSGLLGSWGAGFKFLINGKDVIQQGYDKYKPAPFKVSDLRGWIVILSNPNYLEELRRAPDDVFSFTEAMSDRLATEHTFGEDIHAFPYHLSVVRLQLTRNIGALFPEIRDEIVTSFDEVLDLRGNEWKSISILGAVQRIICRTSNRAYVGLPLCRDPDWIDLNIQYSDSVFKTALVIGVFPKFLRPLAARFCTAVARNTMRGMKHLDPIIKERLEHLEEYGNEWPERPNDLVSWLMEEAKGTRLTVKSLTIRLLVISFASIHTLAMSFTQTIFFLAANPQYVQPLREEVEAIIGTEGWSKSAVSKMHKVDSFLRECQRLEGTFSMSVGRKALKDFTFSDGTLIPKGTMITVASRSMHLDEKLYEDADMFKPFRFAELQVEDEEGSKYHFASTSAEYVLFGHGKHACPGRFFAANVLKAMLAHVVMTYDIKFEDGGSRPRNLTFSDVVLPDPRAKVLFRRRAD